MTLGTKYVPELMRLSHRFSPRYVFRVCKHDEHFAEQGVCFGYLSPSEIHRLQVLEKFKADVMWGYVNRTDNMSQQFHLMAVQFGRNLEEIRLARNLEIKDA